MWYDGALVIKEYPGLLRATVREASYMTVRTQLISLTILFLNFNIQMKNNTVLEMYFKYISNFKYITKAFTYKYAHFSFQETQTQIEILKTIKILSNINTFVFDPIFRQSIPYFLA